MALIVKPCKCSLLSARSSHVFHRPLPRNFAHHSRLLLRVVVSGYGVYLKNLVQEQDIKQRPMTQEPPPKPARRPIRPQKESQLGVSGEFDFDVNVRSNDEDDRQTEPEGSPSNPITDPEISKSPADEATSDTTLPALPPQRPPTRPKSRNIHIQPAPADPPEVREKTDLATELEALDKPGAAEDRVAVERFKATETKLDAEGPGGPTAAQLRYPSLGPQKVYQGNPSPPPKPPTRPARRPRTSEAADDTEYKRDNQFKETTDESQDSEGAKTGPSPYNSANATGAGNGVRTGSSPSELAPIAKETRRDFTKPLDRSFVESEESQISSSNPEGVREQGPRVEPQEKTVPKDLRRSPPSSIQESKKESSHKCAGEASESEIDLRDSSQENEHYATKPDGLASQESAVNSDAMDDAPDSEVTATPQRRDSEPDKSVQKRGDRNVAVSVSTGENPRTSSFAEPEKLDPAEEEFDKIDDKELKGDSSLSNDKVEDQDFSRLVDAGKSDVPGESQFVEPSASEPLKGIKSAKVTDVLDRGTSPSLLGGYSEEKKSKNDVENYEHRSEQRSSFSDPPSISENDARPVAELEKSEDRSLPELSEASKSNSFSEEEVCSASSDQKGVEHKGSSSKSTKATVEAKEDHKKREDYHQGSHSVGTTEPMKSEHSQQDNNNAIGLDVRSGSVSKSEDVKEISSQDKERRVSEPVDPKDVSKAPSSSPSKPESKPVPKPKPKNALASRFEAALRESESPKPKPVLKPKPRQGGGRVAALQASMFADLNDALSKGPPPGGRPRFGSHSEPQERLKEGEVSSAVGADSNETAETQLLAMAKTPRAKVSGPRRTKRLPESAKPKCSTFVPSEPLWVIPSKQNVALGGADFPAVAAGSLNESASDKVRPDDAATSSEAVEDGHVSRYEVGKGEYPQVRQTASSNMQADLVGDAPKIECEPKHEDHKQFEEEAGSHTGDAFLRGELPAQRNSADSNAETMNPEHVRSKMQDLTIDKTAEDGWNAEPVIETRWVPDQISQAVPSQEPKYPEEFSDEEPVQDNKISEAESGQDLPDLESGTEDDLRNALETHLSRDSGGPSSVEVENSKKEDPAHKVVVEDLPPLGSLVDRAASPGVEAASSQASHRSSMESLMTPQRPKPQSSVSSLGVKTLSQYLDKSPQAGAAPSGWDRMPASSQLDLGEAQGLLKGVSELKQQSQLEGSRNSTASQSTSDATEKCN